VHQVDGLLVAVGGEMKNPELVLKRITAAAEEPAP
jgi:hypothetical protein